MKSSNYEWMYLAASRKSKRLTLMLIPTGYRYLKMIKKKATIQYAIRMSISLSCDLSVLLLVVASKMKCAPVEFLGCVIDRR